MKKTEQIAELAANLYLDETGTKGFIGSSIETFLTLGNHHLIYRYVNDPEFFGFSAKGKGESFVFINTFHNMRLRNFTAAHELWHVWNKKDHLFLIETIDHERAADHFAAALMLPEDLVKEMYGKLEELGYNQVQILFGIADQSDMPYEAVLRRFEELKLRTNKVNEEIENCQIDLIKSTVSVRLMKEKTLTLLRTKYGLPESQLDQVDEVNSFFALEKLLSK